MKFKVYIPARYASSRLPGKPLLLVGGKPIVQHVYENARSSAAEDVVIATDDDRIDKAARGFGAAVTRTQSTHHSGTDRIAEAVASRDEDDDTIIVNVQGDEPELPAAVIQQVARLIDANPAVDLASVCEPIFDARALDDPNIVKVVRAADQRALYFSRAPIPYARDGRDAALKHYRRHVGIYAYRVAYLRRFVATPAGELEQIERLEQLRALALNATVVVADAIAPCGVGVDTREDYDRLVEHWRPRRMNAERQIRVLFLCTGNLCRSPMAEGMLRARSVDAGLGDVVLVDSAGMHAELGRAPEPLAIEVALEYGADISGLLSRPFKQEDFDRVDHFIAMDLGHLDFLQATCPQNSTVDIRLLLDDVGDLKKLEVPDPYQQDRNTYEFCARLINVGIDHLVERLFPR